MKNPWLIIGVILFVLIGGSVWYATVVSKSNNEGVVLTEHLKGNLKATVTLTEYSDFQCPACAQFEPVVAELLAKYGDSISFEYKHFPLIQLHPVALPSAEASEAAAVQNKFWEMHDKLFENQEVWSKSPTPNKYFIQYAEEIGLDLKLFKQHLRSSLIKDKVQTEYKEALQLGFTSTPSFLLNGKKMNIATYQDFIEQVGNAVDPKVDLNAITKTAKPLVDDEETKNIASTTN